MKPPILTLTIQSAKGAMARKPVVIRSRVANMGMSKLAVIAIKTEDVFVFGVRRKSKQETGIQAIEVARNGRRLKTETSGGAGARLKSDSMRISQIHSEIR